MFKRLIQTLVIREVNAKIHFILYNTKKERGNHEKVLHMRFDMNDNIVAFCHRRLLLLLLLLLIFGTNQFSSFCRVDKKDTNNTQKDYLLLR